MNNDLLNAAKYAVTGLSMAYDALEKGLFDEAMLHIGHHHAQLNKAVEAVETEQEENTHAPSSTDL